MAKKNKGRRRQGIVSKLTSAIALFIGLSPVFKAFAVSGGNMPIFASEMTRMYTGMNSRGVFSPNSLFEGYAPIAGAVAFKKGVGALVRAAPIKI